MKFLAIFVCFLIVLVQNIKLEKTEKLPSLDDIKTTVSKVVDKIPEKDREVLK